MFIIELPADEYGNRAYTNSQACVIEVELIPDSDRAHSARVLAPARIANNWPTLNLHPVWGMDHIEVTGPARDLTEREYAALVEYAIPSVPQWRIDAANRRAHE